MDKNDEPPKYLSRFVRDPELVRMLGDHIERTGEKPYWIAKKIRYTSGSRLQKFLEGEIGLRAEGANRLWVYLTTGKQFKDDVPDIRSNHADTQLPVEAWISALTLMQALGSKTVSIREVLVAVLAAKK